MSSAFKAFSKGVYPRFSGSLDKCCSCNWRWREVSKNFSCFRSEKQLGGRSL